MSLSSGLVAVRQLFVSNCINPTNQVMVPLDNLIDGISAVTIGRGQALLLDLPRSVGGKVEPSHVESRPPPFFLGEHAALDFLNTVATPWDEQIEWLGSGLDLLVWLVQANLVPASVAERFRRTARKQDLDAVARRARELREWFREFVGAQAGRPLTPESVGRLERMNRLLAR